MNSRNNYNDDTGMGHIYSDLTGHVIFFGYLDTIEMFNAMVRTLNEIEKRFGKIETIGYVANITVETATDRARRKWGMK